MKDARQHARLADVQLPAGLRLGDQPLELLRRSSFGRGVRVRAEHAQDRVRRGIQHHDERVKEDPEELQRSRDPPCKGLGMLDRVELRHDLADDALRGGDQQVGDHHRDRHGEAMSDP